MNLLITSQKGSEAKASAEFKEIALQRGHRKLRIEKSGFDGVLDASFHVVRQFAQTHGTGHAGATLERMQQSLQGVGDVQVLWIRAPVA